MNNSSIFDPDYYIKRDLQKKEIKKLGLFAGAALFSQIVLQEIIVILMRLMGIIDLYLDNTFFQSAVDIIIVFVTMVLPFCFFAKRMKQVCGERELLPLEKPRDTLSFLLSLVAGVGICMLANIITAYFSVYLSFFGVELSSPDIPLPQGAGGFVISFLRVAVTAALAEEIALRGYVMGSLRKYGDKLAIIISAVVFALIHGNLVQAPFALIAGFALGYFTVKTGSLWTGIAIHFINNLLSLFISYSTDWFSEQTANLLYSLVLYGFIFAGAVCLGLFVVRNRDVRLKDNIILTNSEKARAFFLNPLMIAVGLYMFYITMHYVGIAP